MIKYVLNLAAHAACQPSSLLGSLPTHTLLALFHLLPKEATVAEAEQTPSLRVNLALLELELKIGSKCVMANELKTQASTCITESNSERVEQETTQNRQDCAERRESRLLYSRMSSMGFEDRMGRARKGVADEGVGCERGKSNLVVTINLCVARLGDALVLAVDAAFTCKVRAHIALAIELLQPHFLVLVSDRRASCETQARVRMQRVAGARRWAQAYCSLLALGGAVRSLLRCHARGHEYSAEQKSHEYRRRHWGLHRGWWRGWVVRSAVGRGVEEQVEAL